MAQVLAPAAELRRTRVSCSRQRFNWPRYARLPDRSASTSITHRGSAILNRRSRRLMWPAASGFSASMPMR